MKTKIINSINCNLEKPYVIYYGKITTYDTLKSDIVKFNCFFKENNIHKILIKLPQGYFAYSLILAAFLSEVCFCVIDEQSSQAREEHFLSQYNPDVVFGCDTYSANGLYRYINYDDILSSYEETYDIQFCGDSWYSANEDIAYVLFTSGSTGMPKGCRIKRTSINTLMEKAEQIFNINKNDIYGQFAPLFFDMSMLDVFLSVCVGCTLIPFSTQTDKLRPGNVIQRHHITFINAVPQMIEILKRGKQLNLECLESLRLIKLGGDKVRKDIVDELFRNTNINALYVTYGPTEATVFCMVNKITRNDWPKMTDTIVPLGEAIDGYSQIDIVEDEIIVTGVCVASGYLDGSTGGFCKINNKESYRTGDYAISKSGRLIFAGRKDFQHKINGIRIDLSEVELAFSPYCSEVHSICEDGNIIVFVISSYDEEYFFERIVSRMPNIIRPKIIIKLDEFPKLNNGKIDNKKLSSMYGGLK